MVLTTIRILGAALRPGAHHAPDFGPDGPQEDPAVVPFILQRMALMSDLDLNVMALAETLKLRGLNREVGVPRPCFGAVAPGNRKLMVTNSKT